MPQNFVSATAQSIAMARVDTAATIAVCAKSCEKSAIYDGARLSPGEINARRIKACKGGAGRNSEAKFKHFAINFVAFFLRRGFVGLNLTFSQPPAPSLAADRALLREAF